MFQKHAGAHASKAHSWEVVVHEQPAVHQQERHVMRSPPATQPKARPQKGSLLAVRYDRCQPSLPTNCMHANANARHPYSNDSPKPHDWVAKEINLASHQTACIRTIIAAAAAAVVAAAAGFILWSRAWCLSDMGASHPCLGPRSGPLGRRPKPGAAGEFF